MGQFPMDCRYYTDATFALVFDLIISSLAGLVTMSMTQSRRDAG
jgi:hypothetical protein